MLPTSLCSEKESFVTLEEIIPRVPILNTNHNQLSVPFNPSSPMSPELYCLSQDSPNHRACEWQTLKLPNSMCIYVHLLLKLVVRERNRQSMANKQFADWVRYWVFKLLFEPRHKKASFSSSPLCICFVCYQMPFSSTVLAIYIKWKAQR